MQDSPGSSASSAKPVPGLVTLPSSEPSAFGVASGDSDKDDKDDRPRLRDGTKMQDSPGPSDSASSANPVSDLMTVRSREPPRAFGVAGMYSFGMADQSGLRDGTTIESVVAPAVG